MAIFALKLRVFSGELKSGFIMVKCFGIKVDNSKTSSMMLAMALIAFLIFNITAGMISFSFIHKLFDLGMAAKALVIFNLFPQHMALCTVA